MALLDKMKQQAAQVAQKAQEAGRAGQAKLEEVQARRQLDALYRDLGAAAYADHAGRGDQANSAEIERLYGEIGKWEQEHGDAPTDASPGADASSGGAPPAGPSGAETPPAGDFKL
jgi:hypothetical protein